MSLLYDLTSPDQDHPDASSWGAPPHIPTRFLIEEADYCQRHPNLQVISFVHSSVLHSKKRLETRQTWGNASAYDMGDISVKVGVVFMVGRAKNDLERQVLQAESDKYHDIVQVHQ